MMNIFSQKKLMKFGLAAGQSVKLVPPKKRCKCYRISRGVVEKLLTK